MIIIGVRGTPHSQTQPSLSNSNLGEANYDATAINGKRETLEHCGDSSDPASAIPSLLTGHSKLLPVVDISSIQGARGISPMGDEADEDHTQLSLCQGSHQISW